MELKLRYIVYKVWIEDGPTLYFTNMSDTEKYLDLLRSNTQYTNFGFETVQILEENV